MHIPLNIDLFFYSSEAKTLVLCCLKLNLNMSGAFVVIFMPKNALNDCILLLIECERPQ